MHSHPMYDAKVIYTKFFSSYLRTGVKGCSEMRHTLAKPRLTSDEMYCL